jgi:CRP/FNR family transcriptional regulator, nitrogen fixation regulation protein
VAGDVFGFELDADRQLSAEAVSDCALVSYRRRSVETLAKKDATVGRQMFQYAMKNLLKAQRHSLLLGRRGPAEKVAVFLLDWAARMDTQGVIPLAMSRQDIADYLGLNIGTVSRSSSRTGGQGMITSPSPCPPG